jgi:hypothetical protein
MMANHFNSQGYQNIKADAPGWLRPDIIRGTKQNHIPDLTAEKNGIMIILEAETSTSIFDEHTVSQWSLFSDAALKDSGQFHIVVPKGSRDTVNQRLQSLGIVAHEIWTPK